MSLKLYAMPNTCALAPHIALEWINKPYELKLLKRGQHREPEYLQINPKGKAPGATDTAMFRYGKTQEDIQSIIDTTPLGRLGQPEDIANTVMFLLSDQGGWINGQVIHCNGGIS